MYEIYVKIKACVLICSIRQRKGEFLLTERDLMTIGEASYRKTALSESKSNKTDGILQLRIVMCSGGKKNKYNFKQHKDHKEQI